MFIDKVRIYVQGGKGGSGCLSFRREKYIPFGGPNGGNGGRGGDLFLVADRHITTLLDLTYRPHFKAQDGEPGQGWDKAGKAGENLVVHVPCGTVVHFNGELLGDLREEGQTLLAARGGRGGRGNASFKTSRNSAPRIAEKGEPGESKTMDLELKLIADVGLVGFPNSGKSTLLSRISSARPKIADYPFTTLAPNLGVVKFKEKSFIVADIPGLIEGAHQGKGLGMEFLRHVERTRILVHLVDLLGFEGKEPDENVRAIQKEIRLYSKKLAKKPTLLVANKMDCTGASENLKKFKRKLRGKKILGISAVTGEGIPLLLGEILKMLELHPPVIEEEPKEFSAVKRFLFENEFTIERETEGFRVKGAKVERLAAMTNFQQEEAVRRFLNILKKMGVEKMLQREGIQPGDSVFIGEQEFDYSGNLG